MVALWVGTLIPDPAVLRFQIATASTSVCPAVMGLLNVAAHVNVAGATLEWAQVKLLAFCTTDQLTDDGAGSA